MQKITKQFPILNQYVYANTAASGLLYDDLLDWRQEHDLDFLIGGSIMRAKSHKVIENTRETVGQFFGCNPSNVALIPNFSIGINLLLEGLSKEHKVLLIDGDYPSLNWPFENRGFAISKIILDEHLEGNILKAVKTEGITVLALSLVQWLNGIKIDVAFLKNLKKDYPNLIIIADGTQYCGTENFNFEESGIDVLGASGYKWLLAGYGNGFILFKDGVKNNFAPKGIGYNSTNLDLKAKDTIAFNKHFEPGHLDTLNFGSLKFSLDFLSKIGKDTIADHLETLSELAKKELTGLGLLQESVVNRSKHSTIFNIKGGDKLFQHLTGNDVLCAQRGDGIRLSFHFYNTEKDIQKIIKLLKSVK
ncbi:aminotransferase class V-fold PLP-dependent enzyme [Sediminicola arcticus]|jgi:cysteine desulfurase/selenocysteine lyase|uniref:Aminotransferase class V-fold PLP-dependent enzyme n=1 Tax=Sediminicola arcticus TaxID=1574308 RepID=A0ABV2SWF1_9FLAO